MKIIKYLLILIIFCSLTSQSNVADEIKEKFFSNIKALLSKRGEFRYWNLILVPKNIISKTLIIDKIELSNTKINEIGERYNLEPKAIEQIKTTFYLSQPNVYKDFEFSLNNADLNQKVEEATFTEYIGCCFKQDNMINYIIMHLSVNMKIREQYGGGPLNDAQKSEANALINSYSGEIFKLMIDDANEETIIPEKKLEVQSVFTTGQVFYNETYDVKAKITKYGDVEISQISPISITHYVYIKIAKKN